MNATEWPDIIRNMDFSILLMAWPMALPLVIIAIGIFISGRINSALRKYLSRVKGFDDTLIPLAASLSLLILIVTLVAALGSFGMKPRHHRCFGRGRLGDWPRASGRTIQCCGRGDAAIFAAFQVGDWIDTGENSGTVNEIGLFTTIVTTFDNVYISIPIHKFGVGVCQSFKNDTRRMDIDIGIAYETDLDPAEKTLLKLADDDRVLAEPAAQFLVVSYDDARLQFGSGYMLKMMYWPLYWQMMRQVKPALDAANMKSLSHSANTE